jgi:outer membrane cobalamin receptor
MRAEHTVVLLDGIPIGNVQTGLTDLSLIPLDNVERIELVRGGSSAQYGSDALGGAINILTHSPSTSPFVRLDASTSSVGAQHVGVSGQLHFSEELSVRIGSAVEYGRGDFAFTIQDGARRLDAYRSGSDFRSRSLFANGTWELSSQTQASCMVTSYKVDRGTPGPVLSIANQGTARQSDEQVQASASLQTRISEDLEMSVAANFQNAYERYLDRFGIFPADNYYRNMLQRSVEPALFVVAKCSLHPSVEIGHATAAQCDDNQSGRTLPCTLFKIPDLAPFRFHPSLRYINIPSSGKSKVGINMRYVHDESTIGNIWLTIHSTLAKFSGTDVNEHYASSAGAATQP